MRRSFTSEVTCFKRSWSKPTIALFRSARSASAASGSSCTPERYQLAKLDRSFSSHEASTAVSAPRRWGSGFKDQIVERASRKAMMLRFSGRGSRAEMKERRRSKATVVRGAGVGGSPKSSTFPPSER
ncbi:MAG: hypothetical protein IPM79_17080 [Polyangiaceae bacterium]|nr:hypothetical protein [Polyangiaceae bacterium]